MVLLLFFYSCLSDSTNFFSLFLHTQDTHWTHISNACALHILKQVWGFPKIHPINEFKRAHHVLDFLFLLSVWTYFGHMYISRNTFCHRHQPHTHTQKTVIMIFTFPPLSQAYTTSENTHEFKMNNRAQPISTAQSRKPFRVCKIYIYFVCIVLRV